MGSFLLLVHGSLSDVGAWGAGKSWPGEIPYQPAFIWPADHAWCVANDVDPHWAGIAADTPLIERLIADARLDVVVADPTESQPAYR